MAGRGSTIRDVAERAGVSVGTVSKVFNNKGKLAETTRQRVMAAAADLHFAPNALIRSLQQGRTYSLGVFTWDVRVDPSRDITLHLLKGITEGIALAGCDALLYSHLPSRPSGRAPASVFLDGRIDGLVFSHQNLDTASQEALAASDLPVVAVYGVPTAPGIGSVDIDNAGGICAAMEHLFGLGHRRIGFYAPFPTANYSDRRAAYHKSLAERGLPSDLDLCRWNLPASSPPTDPLLLEEALGQAFSLPSPPTALLFGDDTLALEAISLLGARGLRVPEDISVVGFDDVPAAVAPPGLTTIRQPALEVGKLAVRFLQQRIAGEPACHAVLPVTFLPRSTTAPPPSRPLPDPKFKEIFP